MPIGLDAVLNDKNFQDGLRRYENGLNQMEKSTDHTANVLTRIGTVMQGAVVAGLGAMTVAIGGFVAASKVGLDTTLQWAEGLDKLGDQFGLSGEQASGFQFLANKVGLSVDEMGMGLNALTRGLADMKNAQGSNNLVTAKSSDAINGLKDRLADANTKLERARKNLAEAKKPTDAMRYAVDDAQKAVSRLNADIAGATKLVPKAEEKESDFAKALKSLGVSAFNAKGKLKTFDEILPQIMDAFEKLPAGVKSSDLAMQLFGARGGSKFLDFLRQGSKGLTEAQKKAKLLGLQLSTEEVNAAEEFGFAVNELNLGIKGFWNQIGKQVLPVAKQLVDFINAKIIPVFAKWASDNIPKVVRQLQQLGNWIDRHVIPVLEPLSFVLQDVVALFTDFNRPIGDAGNALQAFAADVASLANMFGVDGVKIESMILGIADAISKISEGFKSGGAAGGLQAIGDALAAAVKNVDWAKVQAQLNTWKDQFWNWLTGKGGAIEQVSVQVGKVVTAIAAWAQANAPDWLKVFEAWKTDFWNWLTDKDKGLIVTVADNMAKLADTIEEWARAPETEAQFQKIGKQLATDILNGLGRLFEDSSGKENLFIRLYVSLWNAEQSLRASWNSLGGALGSGIAEGIREYFSRADVVESIRAALYNALATAISVLIPQIKRDFDLFKMVTGGNTPATQPATTPPTPQPAPATNTQLNFTGGRTTPGFARGGWVPFDMQAMIHAGEYVLNRQQARAFAPILAGANNSRTYNFNNTWNGNASAIDRGELARIAEDSAYRGIQRAMRGT